MNSKTAWLIIEPYVHVEVKNKTVFLFNFINKEKIIFYSNNSLSQRIADSLKKRDYVIEINKKDIEDKQFEEFIEKIRETFSGDIISSKLYPNKPVQILQNARIENPELKDIDTRYIQYSEKRHLLSHLSNLNIYINSGNLEKNIYDNAYKQFLVNYNSGTDYCELDYETIHSIFTEEVYYATNLRQINILGGNLFIYSKIKSLLHLIKQLDFGIRFSIRDIDFRDTEPSLIKNFLNSINSKALVKIFISLPLKIELLNTIRQYIKEYKFNYEFYFIVENETQYAEIEKYVYSEDIYYIQPFFNNKNLDFFKENVFIDENDIFDQKLEPRDAEIRKQVNTLLFGEINILSNGDINDNVNMLVLGNIYHNRIYEIVFQLLTNNNNAWNLVRKNVKPCCDCLYSSLCTPISSYELAIKHFNLCNLKN